MSPHGLNVMACQDGYVIERSDGLSFTLRARRDGSAVLCKGDGAEVVDFHVSVKDPLERAQKWAVAFPDHPEE